MPCNFEVFKMPGYNAKTYPYLLMRDDYGLKVFNVTTRSLVQVKDAVYNSPNGYRTMDIVAQSEESREFEAVYLETVDDDSGQTSTVINRVVFSETFADSLR